MPTAPKASTPPASPKKPARKRSPTPAASSWAAPGSTVIFLESKSQPVKDGRLAVIKEATAEQIVIHVYHPAANNVRAFLPKNGDWLGLGNNGLIVPPNDPQPTNYELTGETKIDFGAQVLVHRTRIVTSGSGQTKGEAGGWVQSLHMADGRARIPVGCWLLGDATLVQFATLEDGAGAADSARLSGHSRAIGGANIRGQARLGDWAVANGGRIFDRASMSGFTRLGGNHPVLSGDAIVRDNAVVESATVTGRAAITNNAQVIGNPDGPALQLGGTVHVGENAFLGGAVTIRGEEEIGLDAAITLDAHTMFLSQIGPDGLALTMFRTKIGYTIQLAGRDSRYEVPETEHFASLHALEASLAAGAKGRGDRVSRKAWKFQREGVLLMLRATIATW